LQHPTPLTDEPHGKFLNWRSATW